MNRIAAMNENTQAMSIVNETLTSSPAIGSVLATVAEQIGAALNVSSVDIYECPPEHDVFRCDAAWRRAGVAEVDYAWVGSLTKLSEWPPWQRVIDERVVVELRTDDPAMAPEERASLTKWDILVNLTAPLLVADEVVGLVCVAQTDYMRTFDMPESGLFSRLASLASLAIANATMLRIEEQHTRRLTSLFDASRLIAESLDASEITDHVELELHRAYGSSLESCSMRLTAADGRQLPTREALVAGPEATLEADDRVDPVVDATLRRRKPTQVSAPGERERLVIPLETRREIVGYLELVSCAGQHFCPADVELVQIVANQAAGAVKNAALYRDIEHQARTDGLTGLHNHRYFLERLDQELTRARRTESSLGLLMIDVDAFKEYNDAYGHQAGDAALVRIAGVMRSEVREGIDLVGRYGGDEFVVLLPNSGAESNSTDIVDDASLAATRYRAVADRIRIAVEQRGCENPVANPPRSLTVSVGCSLAGC